jgi:hypothetical protein
MRNIFKESSTYVGGAYLPIVTSGVRVTDLVGGIIVPGALDPKVVVHTERCSLLYLPFRLPAHSEHEGVSFDDIALAR